MAGDTKLTSGADGFGVDAYHAEARGERRGGLVLLPEIFGVNANIRALADGFAADGLEVIAPSLFDRIEPGFQADYDPAGSAKGVAISRALDWKVTAADIQAAVDALAGPVFVGGFCWGGSATWVAACRCTGLAAAAAFYGRLIPDMLDERPRCPLIFHFGEDDASIPPEAVERVRRARPDGAGVFTYEGAGHAFMREGNEAFRPEAAALARRRTLEFFDGYAINA